MATPPRKSGRRLISPAAEWANAFQLGAETSNAEPVLGTFGHTSVFSSSPAASPRLERAQTKPPNASDLAVPLLSVDPKLGSSATAQGWQARGAAAKSPPRGDGHSNGDALLSPATTHAAKDPWYQSVVKAMLYGLINTIVVTPVMVGFAAIIFRHKAFHQDVAIYSQLVKLVLFSSAMHQMAFTCTSSLPFAIGQVQDAGLIFLSKIACEIADAMRDDPPEHMLSTVLVTLSSSTALLGVALMLTGYWKLAGLVQYLPLPVVGGYLAFIGLYCLEAGVSLMSGQQVDSLLGFDAIEQWSALLITESLYYTLPGILIGISILLVLQRYHHYLVLPALLLAIPVAFYTVMLCLGNNHAVHAVGVLTPED